MDYFNQERLLQELSRTNLTAQEELLTNTPRTYPSIMRELRRIEADALETMLEANSLRDYMDEQTRTIYANLQTKAATIKPQL